jgi:hypothetical protein
MSPSRTNNSESQSWLSDELRMIPQWSVGLAVLSFLAIQYIFWVVMPAHRHHPGPPPGFHAYFAVSWGFYAALYSLTIGYVSKDAPRRSMSRIFWVLVCLLTPGGIGAVLYFLMRQPITSICPACSTPVQNEFHFCPQCAFQISASCGSCFRSVRVTDLYCVYCGHELAKDNAPARLRAYQN